MGAARGCLDTARTVFHGAVVTAGANYVMQSIDHDGNVLSSRSYTRRRKCPVGSSPLGHQQPSARSRVGRKTREALRRQGPHKTARKKAAGGRREGGWEVVIEGERVPVGCFGGPNSGREGRWEVERAERCGAGRGDWALSACAGGARLVVRLSTASGFLRQEVRRGSGRWRSGPFAPYRRGRRRRSRGSR